MSAYNPQIFTQYVYDILIADGSLGALISGIYTYTPQDTPTPYLVIAIDSARSLNAAEFAGMEVEFSVTCFSSEAGYTETYSIVEKVVENLQASAQALTGYTVVNTRLTNSQYERLRDGVGIEATLEFRSVIQEI